MTALRRLFAHCLALVMVFALTVQPAMAQSILRDAETEALLNDMAAPLVRAAGLDPRNMTIVLVADPSINAFVAGGQVIYLHTGLINEAGSALEVQGVIAHELGHITGGHVINDAGARQATGISILSLVLGGLAAAAGSGDAAIGVLMAGQQAALGHRVAKLGIIAEDIEEHHLAGAPREPATRAGARLIPVFSLHRAVLAAMRAQRRHPQHRNHPG